MLKSLTIFAALVVLGTGSVNAQQREAILQKIAVPGASFDVVLAMAKPGSPVVYYRNQPDPNIINLGNDLVIAYTVELSETLDLATLMRPAQTIVVERGDKMGRTPVVVYFVPKREGLAGATMR